MPACPICTTPSAQQRHGTPYWMCSGCGVWFQDPPPPKVWHGPHETNLGQPMPDDEKRANEQLATFLFEEVMGSKIGAILDVGVSYPYLAHCLRQKGCLVMGIDGDGQENDLGVHVMRGDFETFDPAQIGPRHLVTFVHSFEHVYDPVAVFGKLRQLMENDGALFIRMPDNQVQGIERDLTPGHYEIHPYIHALSSIAELCARTGDFVIEKTYELHPGQRDMVLRPT